MLKLFHKSEIHTEKQPHTDSCSHKVRVKNPSGLSALQIFQSYWTQAPIKTLSPSSASDPCQSIIFLSIPSIRFCPKSKSTCCLLLIGSLGGGNVLKERKIVHHKNWWSFLSERFFFFWIMLSLTKQNTSSGTTPVVSERHSAALTFKGSWFTLLGLRTAECLELFRSYEVRVKGCSSCCLAAKKKKSKVMGSVSW